MSHKTTDLYVLIDRSGSMRPLAATVVKEVNRLAHNVGANDPEATVTIIAFDSNDVFDVLTDHEAPRGQVLSQTDYQPGGGTPLYDAISETLTFVSRHQRRNRPARRIVVAVMTDGQENSSRHYTALDVLGKIQRRQAAGWDLLYLGVGDVFADAAHLGFHANQVHPWESTDHGTAAAFATITAATIRRRPHQPAPRRR